VDETRGPQSSGAPGSGRVVLVTGGARGIGRATALDLASDGWDVAFCYRTSRAAALQVEAEIQDRGRRALSLAADVAVPDEATRLVERVLHAWGRLDALVNCAGPYRRVPILEETPEGWRSMLANNLDATYYVCRAAIPTLMEQRSGRIVNFAIANVDRLVAQPTMTAYAIAKMGVLMLTRTLARTLAPHGITVNAISPGYIDAPDLAEAERQDAMRRIPAGHLGTGADAAHVVRFLLSAEASYVTGANIPVSGGWGI